MRRQNESLIQCMTELATRERELYELKIQTLENELHLT